MSGLWESQGQGETWFGGASLKALPGLILCPQLVLYWTGGAKGGDALQVLRHMGSMGTCPWETPLIRSPNLRRAEASPERRTRESSPSSGTSSVTGDGTWHFHVHPQLGSQCWRGRSSPFPELRDVAWRGKQLQGTCGPVVSPARTYPLERAGGCSSAFPPTVHLPRSILRDQGGKIPLRGRVPQHPEPGEPRGEGAAALPAPRQPPRPPVRRAGTRWGWHHAAAPLRPAPAGLRRGGWAGGRPGRGLQAGLRLPALPGEQRGLREAED